MRPTTPARVYVYLNLGGNARTKKIAFAEVRARVPMRAWAWANKRHSWRAMCAKYATAPGNSTYSIF